MKSCEMRFEILKERIIITRKMEAVLMRNVERTKDLRNQRKIKTRDWI